MTNGSIVQATTRYKSATSAPKELLTDLFVRDSMNRERNNNGTHVMTELI